MTVRYTGMNPDGTGQLTDTDQLWNSVRDILTTPLASRVMRRDYGSMIPDLLDEPQNEVTRLQCMSAAVIALTMWEPRIALNVWGGDHLCMDGSSPRKQREALRDKA